MYTHAYVHIYTHTRIDNGIKKERERERETERKIGRSVSHTYKALWNKLVPWSKGIDYKTWVNVKSLNRLVCSDIKEFCEFERGEQDMRNEWQGECSAVLNWKVW